MREQKDSRETRRQIRNFKPACRRIEIVEWPGTGNDVGLLYLSCSEQQEAYFAARDHFARKGQEVDTASASQLDSEHGYQLCLRMIVSAESPTKPQQIFRNADEARKELSPNEAEWFVNEHIKLQTSELLEWGELGEQDEEEELSEELSE